MFSKNSYKVNEAQKDVGHHKKKELEDIAAETLRQVIDNMDGHVEMENISDFEKKQFNEKIFKTLNELLTESSLHLSQGEKQKVIEYVSNEMFGFGPINCLIHDPSVTEIMVNGNNKVYVEKDGKIHKTDVTFRDDDHVLHIINKIINPLGRRIDESSPTVDARLPDGSRVNAIIPPLSINGPSLTIRKFSTDPFKTEDLINFGSITREMVDFLEACVKTRLNIIVSGGTGSGKTTTLNVLSSFIPEGERIVTIEDTAELQLRQDHVVTLESRPANIEGRGEYTIRELVRNCLRMRPDRIVVGEVRGGETLDMLQAMNTGHDGSISTLHANSPRDALVRLETMVLMAGMELPLRAIREQIASAVHIIVQQARMSDGSRKIVRITELVGMEGDNIKTQDIFVYEQEGTNKEGRVHGSHKTTGIIPLCLDKILLRGEEFTADRIPQWAEHKNTDNQSRLEENNNTQQPALQEELSRVSTEEISSKTEINSAAEMELQSSNQEDESRKTGSSIPNIDVSCTGPDLAETGDTVTFTITVTNKSENLHLSDCVVTSSRPEITRNTGYLPAGEKYTYQLQYTLQPEDHPFLENKIITVTSDPDCYEVEVSDKHVVAVMKPQIHAACVGPNKSKVGDAVQYCIIVNNTSDNVDLLDVVITDSSQNWTKIINFFPAGATETFDVSYIVSEKDYPKIESLISVSAVNRFGEGVRAKALHNIYVEQASEKLEEQENVQPYDSSTKQRENEKIITENHEAPAVSFAEQVFDNNNEEQEESSFLSPEESTEKPVVHGLQLFSFPNAVKSYEIPYYNSETKHLEEKTRSVREAAEGLTDNNKEVNETFIDEADNPAAAVEEPVVQENPVVEEIEEDLQEDYITADSEAVVNEDKDIEVIKEGPVFKDVSLNSNDDKILLENPVKNENSDQKEELPHNEPEAGISNENTVVTDDSVIINDSCSTMSSAGFNHSDALEKKKPESYSNSEKLIKNRFQIPEGMRGISISICSGDYTAAFVGSGDRIDLLAVYSDEKLNSELSAATIAENVLVISWPLGDREGRKEGETVQAMLAVTPKQAEKIVYAGLNGSLHCILR